MWIKELNESEPTKRCREELTFCPKRGLALPVKEHSGYLFIGYVAGGIELARLLSGLLLGNWEAILSC